MGAFDQVIISKQKALYYTASIYKHDWSGSVMWEDTGIFRRNFLLLIFERVYLFPWLRLEDGNFPNIFFYMDYRLSGQGWFQIKYSFSSSIEKTQVCLFMF